MGAVCARRVLLGATVAEAEALWYDLDRWPSFVDGFGSVVRIKGEWPKPGTRLIWEARQGGRGRVEETIVSYVPGVSCSVRVGDPQLFGTQAVRFEALAGEQEGCAVTIGLDYKLESRPGFVGALTDLFFVRRQLRESLRRTLDRLAVELRADRELAS